MALDESIVLLGEDVGKRGGVFLATEGLFERYGPDRVIDTPPVRSGDYRRGGRDGGARASGLLLKFSFQIMYTPASTNSSHKLPNYVTAPADSFLPRWSCGCLPGAASKADITTRKTPKRTLFHTPGLKVVYPSSPADAKGLLSTAIRDDDPVIFMEPKRLYRAFKEEVPDGEHLIPLGQARVKREGDDVVLVSYGASVAETLKAADALAEQEISAHVIDLRSLQPWDKTTVLEAVAQLGRVVLVSEAPKTGGFVSEVAATISEEVLDMLLAPPVRVTGFDTPYPYAQDRLYLPGVNRILRAVQRVLDY